MINEIRIGNFVLMTCDGKTFNTRIDIGDFMDISMGYKAIQPLELTDEILLKCGFVLNDGKYEMETMKSKLFLRKCYLGGFYWGINSSDCSFCEFDDVEPIEYLHSLQNFIHALTGQELKIDL